MMLIDNFPFTISFDEDTDYSENVIILSSPCQFKLTPEVEEQRIEALRESWRNNDERRKLASERLKEMRSTMPPAHSTLSEKHKENIAKKMKGNQNKTGKKGGNQWTKKREHELNEQN